jgi:hypothetical protein
MRSRFLSTATLSALGLLLLLLAGIPLSRAQPGRALQQPEPERTRALHAVFSSTNAGGIVTEVILDVTDAPDGGEAVIEVSRYRATCANNGCPQVLLHTFNRIPLAAGDVQFDPNLNAMTLRTTRPVGQQLTPGSGTVALDLTWRAVGDLARDEHSEGELFRRGQVSGSIRAGNINFTPKRSVDAQIEVW